MSDFIYTTAISKIRKLSRRTRIIQGGSSAGKTFAILTILINTAATNKNILISVVGESVPFLRRGPIRDFFKILDATQRAAFGEWNKSNLTFSLPNGSTIEFFSVEDESRVRGPRRDILYVNEANNIPWETYHQLAIRTSGKIWIDFNPVAEFWAHTELMNDADSDFIVLVYKDNEALSESIVKELEKGLRKAYYNTDLSRDELTAESNIKSSYWANWCKTYLFGEVGHLEGVIFNNWKIIDNIPDGARLAGRGLDFGYSNDPAALVDVYKYNDSYIVDERLYQTGMLNGEIAKYLDNDVFTYADSAEPKSIDEIKNCGIYKIQGTAKGADSINFGIQLLQGVQLLITSRSTNLIKELRGYCWDKDRSGKMLAKPVGADHAIDALRYWAMMSINQAESWPKIWAASNY